MERSETDEVGIRCCVVCRAQQHTPSLLHVCDLQHGLFNDAAFACVSAYVSIRQQSSVFVSIHQHTSAYVSLHVCDLQHGLFNDACAEGAAYVSIPRYHTSAYVSIRQHTSAYVSIRQHTSAYVSELCALTRLLPVPKAPDMRSGSGTALPPPLAPCQHTSAYVSTRQHTSAHVGIRQHTSAYVSIREEHLGCRDNLRHERELYGV
jgi:hypothetical protein